MRRFLISALAGAAIAAAAPAHADAPGGVAGGIVDACSAVYVTNAIACQGYYGGNLFNDAVGAATPADLQTAINALLTSATNSTGAYIPPYVIDTSHVLNVITSSSGNVNGSPYNYVFSGPSFSGLTVFGAHFGNQPDAGNQNNISALWLVNVGASPTNTIQITNGQGVSNAAIFGFRPAVPEPATWAMMLVGFGGIGMAMRRSRRGMKLAQVA